MALRRLNLLNDCGWGSGSYGERMRGRLPGQNSASKR